MRSIATLTRYGVLLGLLGLPVWTPFTAAPDAEIIRVMSADCVTPKTFFTLGDTVCAVATGALLGPPTQRQFEWVAPNGTIFRLGPDIVSDPDSNSISLPISGPYAQVGTWMVKSVDRSNNGYAVAQFMVQDPNKTAADLSVNLFAPFQVSPGANVTFTLRVSNNGPNEAENVQIKIGAASNATTLSAEQIAGPPFTWVAAMQGANSTGICTIATLPVNATASFAFVYHLDPGTPTGASVTSTATISSATFEAYTADNLATATATITPQPCTVNCPANITMMKPAGQCGAAVTYAPPGATGSNCGALTCSPASGSFFPTGATAVICAGNTGSPCSFTVTVDDPQPLALTCPADLTISESSPDMGFAIVKYKPPTTSDHCAAGTATCTPPSGSSFPVGVITVTCEVNNAAGDRTDCSFTVTVTSSDCDLRCPANILRSTSSGECGAAINYPAPSTTGNCGIVTCAPPSGAIFPIGVTTVACASSMGASATFTITIQDTQAPGIIKISASPAALAPLNRKLQDVTINYASTDNCSGAVTSALRVTSNAPVTGTTDRQATPDWEIVDAHHVRLRAGRDAKGNGHIYTITITCTDAGGNSSSKSVTVNAGRDQR